MYLYPSGLTNYPTLFDLAHAIISRSKWVQPLLDNSYLTVCGTADVQRCYIQPMTFDWHLSCFTDFQNGLSGVFNGRYLQDFVEGDGAMGCTADIVSITVPLNVMEGYAMWCPRMLAPIVLGSIGTLNIGAIRNIML